MSDEQVQNNDTPPTAFITGADTGAGLRLIENLVREGYRVVGATTNGTVGAMAIRAKGGIPAYSELTRAESLKSDIVGAQASVVVHLAPNALNTSPHTFPDDWRGSFPLLASADAITQACKGAKSVQRLIAVSPAYLYGDTHGASVDESAHLAHDTDLQKIGQKAEIAFDMYDNTVIVRAGYTYGAYSADIVQMAQHLKAGKRVLSSDATSNWIHEDDLASAIITIIKAEETEKIYNAVAIHATPNQFADAFGMALGVGVANKGGGFSLFSAEDAPSRLLLAQSSKVTSEKLIGLGWQAQYKTLDQAFDRTTLVWRAQEAPPEPANTSTEIINA